ncbi:MAG: transglycosylase SLT domain-containing protein [Gallionellaceae bacterium]|nr:transglycosylase SLT domain-containing protein [Gallionellaceae bacterium]
MKFLLFFLLLIPAVSVANQDEDFLSAREAFQKGNAAQLERMISRLKNSPLEPYLTYYQLRLHWDGGDSPAIKQFLTRPVDSPVMSQFRNEWLKRLAMKQRWTEFAAEFPQAINVDAELNCYAIQQRAQTNEEAALIEAREKWFSGIGQPESCSTLFETALNKGVITEQDILNRTRLALENGNVTLAKQLAAKLPKKFEFPVGDLDKASADPERFLSKRTPNKFSDGERVVVSFALQRLAKQLPQLAYSEWKKIASNFPEAEQRYFLGRLAFETARAQNPRALEWFKAAGDTPLNELQLAWRTRAALRAQNWHEVWVSVTAMSPQQQQESAWRYWKARALKSFGRNNEAQTIFTELSREYNFYGQLASEELGTAPASGIVTARHQPSKEELNWMQALPAIQRTFALYRMELRTEASREWAWATRNFDDKKLLVAAELAQSNGMFDRSINAADRTAKLHDFNLRYPAPFRQDLQGNLREHGLEEAWVYGLMRQESRFATHAKSNVGAAGLMQIMPATAKWVARKMGMRDYRSALIHDTEVNLKLGTYYMKNVLSSFDNNAAIASAAYNAGPGRARHWRGEIPLEGAIYAECIPFDETRDYVKKVMSNTVYYSKLFGQPSVSLKQRLGIIEAKNQENQKPIPDEK